MGLLPFCLFTFLPLNTVAKKHKQLVILHTNDTHSTIMPLNPNLDNKDLAGRGGFLRRVNLIKEERSQHPNLLLFDSGDFSQGSGYYTLLSATMSSILAWRTWPSCSEWPLSPSSVPIMTVQERYWKVW